MEGAASVGTEKSLLQGGLQNHAALAWKFLAGWLKKQRGWEEGELLSIPVIADCGVPTAQSGWVEQFSGTFARCPLAVLLT